MIPYLKLRSYLKDLPYNKGFMIPYLGFQSYLKVHFKDLCQCKDHMIHSLRYLEAYITKNQGEVRVFFDRC